MTARINKSKCVNCRVADTKCRLIVDLVGNDFERETQRSLSREEFKYVIDIMAHCPEKAIWID